jgi:formylglycine-generating enzyme required for sulfatase activity
MNPEGARGFRQNGRAENLIDMAGRVWNFSPAN